MEGMGAASSLLFGSLTLFVFSEAVASGSRRKGEIGGRLYGRRSGGTGTNSMVIYGRVRSKAAVRLCWALRFF